MIKKRVKVVVKKRSTKRTLSEAETQPDDLETDPRSRDSEEEDEETQEEILREVDALGTVGASEKKRRKILIASKKSSKSLTKKERKLLTRERRGRRIQNFENLQKAKNVWEKARPKSTSEEKKKEATAEIIRLLDGKYLDFVTKHDGSRVIQWVLSCGSSQERSSVIGQLLTHVEELSRSEYGRHLVKKMAEVGTKEEKEKLLDQFLGKIRLMLRHKLSSEIVEYMYAEVCNARQKRLMLQEFFGNEFLFFKDESISSLEDVFLKHPHRKKDALKNLSDYLTSISAKEIQLNYTIVQRLFFEYLSQASCDEAVMIIDMFLEASVHVLHTKDGSAASVLAFSHGNAKQKRSLLRSYKDKIADIARDPYGHMVLCRALLCIDDTVLLHKSLISELLSSVSLEDVSAHRSLRNVFSCIINGDAPSKYFSPAERALISPDSDGVNTKKCRSVRRDELLSKCLPELVRLFASGNSLRQSLQCKHCGQLLCDIAANSSDMSAMSEFAENLCDLVIEREDEIIQDMKSVLSIKGIIRISSTPRPQPFEPRRPGASSDDVPSSSSAVVFDFASTFLRRLQKRLLRWCTSGVVGSYIVASLLDSDSSREGTLSLLSSSIQTIRSASERSSEFKGSQLVCRLYDEFASKRKKSS